MKKGQIVCALVTCSSTTCSQESCPYWGQKDCTDKLMLDAAVCIVCLYKGNMDLADEVELTQAKLNALHEEMRNADKNDNV